MLLEKLHLVVQDDFWDAGDVEVPGEIRELLNLHHVSRHALVLDRHLMGQTGHRWAMGSRGRRENLNVDIFIQRAERFTGIFTQRSRSLGNS